MPGMLASPALTTRFSEPPLASSAHQATRTLSLVPTRVTILRQDNSTASLGMERVRQARWPISIHSLELALELITPLARAMLSLGSVLARRTLPKTIMPSLAL